ncbi:MAG TPA: DUF2288 domain-containing protein [Gammaproteobacteria bacterium]|nr:DUF2288 domain-containing protein [Gammaproteobacteria bacterium]
MKKLTDEELRGVLNGQTGKLEWQELEKHFARGVVIKVDPAMDLIKAGAAFVQDNKQQIEAWMNDGKVCNANDSDALDWSVHKPMFWTVVVAPWVLVQVVTEPE